LRADFADARTKRENRGPSSLRSSPSLGITPSRKELLMAVISALATLKRACEIEITTDSQYVRNGITQWVHAWKKNGWRNSNKQDVKNKDLWERLDAEVQRHPQIKWHWVKGHSGHPENTLADEIANYAIDKFLTKV